MYRFIESTHTEDLFISSLKARNMIRRVGSGRRGTLCWDFGLLLLSQLRNCREELQRIQKRLRRHSDGPRSRRWSADRLTAGRGSRLFPFFSHHHRKVGLLTLHLVDHMIILQQRKTGCCGNSVRHCNAAMDLMIVWVDSLAPKLDEFTRIGCGFVWELYFSSGSSFWKSSTTRLNNRLEPTALEVDRGLLRETVSDMSSMCRKQSIDRRNK